MRRRRSGRIARVRLALIANPRSGTAPDPQALEELLGADGAQVVTRPIDELTGPADDGFDDEGLTAALRTLCAGGQPDRIVVAGGDGSIGPAALLAAELGVPLAVLPVGTANDFARAQGLPLDLAQAGAVARATGAGTRHAELALADRRPFVNAAAAGLSVAAAQAARPHKPRLGRLAYAVGAMRAAVTAEPLRCTVRCDGQERFAGRAWQVVVGATGAFGGGSEIGGTDARDGLLDVAVVPVGSRVGLVRRAYGMRRGRLTAQDGVMHDRGAVVEVALAGRPAFNVDGELCRCDPARFALRPGGFEVVVA
jgi:diacylglycerol kinase family enzyme